MPQSPKALESLPCIVFTGIANTGTWIFRENGKQTSVKVNGPLQCNQAKSAVEACAAGLGFGMFLSYQVMPLITGGELIVVLEQFESETIPVNIVFHHTRLMAPHIRLLIDYLSEELKVSLLNVSG